jgi:acyl homoserine lactone synthase
MQILSVSPNQYIDRLELLTQMHCLRAAVFSERLDWDVTITEAGERDEYDDLEPTYIIAVKNDDRVAGCARLLPALGPTMLERTFPQLLANGSLNASARMVESSRFCVDTSSPAGRRGAQLHLTTLAMFAGIIEWSMTNGYEQIVTATDLRFERILNRAGWPMKRLSEPVAIGNTVAVAGTLPADRKCFEQVRPSDYRSTISEHPNRQVRSVA